MSTSCDDGVSYTGSTPALGAGRLGPIPSTPTKKREKQLILISNMSIEDGNLRSEMRNRAWDNKAASYWRYEEGKRNPIPVAAFEEFYQQHKDELKDVLDVGCGTGRFLIPMAQDGLNVTGLEPSDGMRQGAEENVRAAQNTLKGEVKLVKGESRQLDFPDESFDFVFAKGSIHHNTWAEIEQSFTEIARVLRRGKFFLFQGRSTEDSALLRSELVANEVGNTAQDSAGFKKGVYEHYFDEDEIRKLATQNGFEIVLGPQEEIKNPNTPQKKHGRWWIVYKKT